MNGHHSDVSDDILRLRNSAAELHSDSESETRNFLLHGGNHWNVSVTQLPFSRCYLTHSFWLKASPMVCLMSYLGRLSAYFVTYGVRIELDFRQIESPLQAIL